MRERERGREIMKMMTIGPGKRLPKFEILN